MTFIKRNEVEYKDAISLSLNIVRLFIQEIHLKPVIT